jgi:phage/plasmid-like protein (TIGR03299 family)
MNQRTIAGGERQQRGGTGMAHALDETYGLDNSMVFVGDLPWHRFGKQIPPNLTVDEAITACPAVDFTTKLVPVRYKLSTFGEWMNAENFRIVVRDDTGAALGVVTKRYSPVQIRDQWKGLDPLIEAGLASIESMGSIHGGKRVWGLVKFKSDEIPEWDDLQNEVGRLDTYALTMDVKGGGGPAIIAPSSVRVVCNNTLEAAIGGLTQCVRVIHVGDTTAKIEAAAEELWGGIIKAYERLARRYRLLKSVTLSEADHASLVQDAVAIIPTDKTKFSSAARFNGAVQRAAMKRNTVRDLWIDGAGHAGDRSAWEALNGLVEALDHNRAGAFRTPNNSGKINSMLCGTEAQLKARVTRNLVEFSREKAA